MSKASVVGVMTQSVTDTVNQINAAEMKAAKANVDKDGAYAERDKLVALLARLFPSGVLPDPKEPDWQIIYVDLPTGQASWHVHNSEYALFKELPVYAGKWDNHTTGEKYARIEKLTKTLDKFDVAITPKSAQLPEDEPVDGPEKITVAPRAKGKTALAVLRNGDRVLFTEPIVIRAMTSLSADQVGGPCTTLYYEEV